MRSGEKKLEGVRRMNASMEGKAREEKQLRGIKGSDSNRRSRD